MPVRKRPVATFGLRCFPEARCNQGRQKLRASEAGLLAGLFPSPAFGTRRVQSAIRKAAIKYKVPYITILAGAYNTVKGIAITSVSKKFKGLQRCSPFLCEDGVFRPAHNNMFRLRTSSPILEERFLR